MTKQDILQQGYLKTQTAIIFICIAFVLGLFSGVLLTILKTEKKSPNHSVEKHESDAKKTEQSLKSEATRNPQNASIWTQLGNIYFDSGQYEKAINAYEKSIKVNPHNPNVLTDLGVMHRRSRNPEKAIHFFDKAIAADPKHEMSRLNKGIVLMHDLKDREAAIKAWEELLEVNPLAMASKEQSVDEMLRHYKEHENK